MVKEANQYQPDYAVPPGAILAERLEAYGISHAEFARRCGRSAKLISEIISGKAPVEPKTALQFERVLGVDAGIWLGIETDYQLHRAREEEARQAKQTVSWMKTLPLEELVKRRVVARPASDLDAVSKLLAFYGVGSVEAWDVKYKGMSVAFRHSTSFESDKASLTAWLRIGELNAERKKCLDYNPARFKQALRRVRELTQKPIEGAMEEAQQLCSDAGVALELIKPFPRTAISAAAWWLTPRKAVIALSARHKTDDHLWFSLFHESAHILLHSKKTVFIDGTQAGGKVADIETQADQWASDFLVPRPQWERFRVFDSYSESYIRQFAKEQGIAPGIVVGRLQHEGRLSWGTRLNKLKVRLEWGSTS